MIKKQLIKHRNNATADDVILLKHNIEETVFKKYQIKLETEVRVKGE